MMLDRDGLHSGAWQWALRNSVPREARPSMFGVFACGCPPRQPTQSFRSSMAMKRTLGRLEFGSAFAREAPMQISAKSAIVPAMVVLFIEMPSRDQCLV